MTIDAKLLADCRTIAEWHIGDGDECGVLARSVVERIDALSKETMDFLEYCTCRDLYYRAHQLGYGLGNVVFGVEITEKTSMMELMKALISRCAPKE